MSRRVVGCWGMENTASTLPCSTKWPCSIAGHAVGKLTHHIEVVGDQQNPDMAYCFCRSARSPRICWRTVTSSAVVGSSASNSLGRQANAMAIMARCRWPPESWCRVGLGTALWLGHTGVGQQGDRLPVGLGLGQTHFVLKHLSNLLHPQKTRG